MEFEIATLFAGDPAAMELCARFCDALLARWPECTLKFSRTQLSFSDGVGFAFASRPPRRAPGGVLVSLGLRAPLHSPRVFAQTEPYPGRWTVHILLRSADELDAELMSWIDDAHEYAVERAARRGRRKTSNG